LSLIPVMRRCCPEPGLLLDIGSGGGFPAIPIKVVAPEYDVVLVERSARKAGFLRKVIGRLGLRGATVFAGTFPECARSIRPELVTARAVEDREDLHEKILTYLASGSTFLCPSQVHDLSLSPVFHVERIEDEWSKRGLRRSVLYTITRA
jgi:16S rRNA (guanine527-N7)-methyltransferase